MLRGNVSDKSPAPPVPLSKKQTNTIPQACQVRAACCQGNVFASKLALPHFAERTLLIQSHCFCCLQIAVWFLFHAIKCHVLHSVLPHPPVFAVPVCPWPPGAADGHWIRVNYPKCLMCIYCYSVWCAGFLVFFRINLFAVWVLFWEGAEEQGCIGLWWMRVNSFLPEIWAE